MQLTTDDQVRLGQSLARQRAKWAADGLTEERAIELLISAADLVEQDPAFAIKMLMKITGVTLDDLRAKMN